MQWINAVQATTNARWTGIPVDIFMYIAMIFSNRKIGGQVQCKYVRICGRLAHKWLTQTDRPTDR